MTKKMTVNQLQSAARAVGIQDNILSRWTNVLETNADAVKNIVADDNTLPRFDLIGPIVDDALFSAIGEPIGMSAPTQLKDFLKENRGKDIEIAINSPGGSCWDANAMVSELLRHDGFVNIVVMGACFSAATYFLGVPNSHRVAMPGSEFMIHNAWSVAQGDHRDMSKMSTNLKRTSESIAAKLEKTTNLSKDTIMQMMEDETWFNDNEALESGLVDEIYGADDEEEDENETEEVEEVLDEESEDDLATKPEAMKRGDMGILSLIDLLRG